MSMVRRVYVEKKPGFRTEAEALRHDLKHNLNLAGLTAVHVLYRYDIEGLSEATYQRAVSRILSEAPVDDVFEETVPGLEEEGLLFAVEYLPGQYDQRADSAEQCIRILKADEAPVVRYAKVIVLKGEVSEQELEAVKAYTINAVDSREAELAKPDSLDMEYGVPDDVAVVEGFRDLDDAGAADMVRDLGLAMSLADLKHTQKYFREIEQRDPTITEIRVLDTYWSDHCRHTTFSTVIEGVEIEESPLTQPLKEAFEEYKEGRAVLGREEKPFCLMDIALAAMRELKKAGKLTDQEDTDEINACSIVIPVDVDGKEEEWLLQFKNETHNHPTEIEPFGGAATCLGGAIRDPLSGRSYVYQAMRLTGGADPTVPVSETLHGKLPQKKLTREAAKGYSSYGNQIGLATGYVKEIYHPGYMAKHMELGAVIAATPRDKVTRLHADPGDIVILLGGRTGRDGIGGATGSSKAHTETSLDTCGAEVQKGNPPTERKLQRLFRNEEASRMIKICNDFGAGGVCVAIGELAPGLDIELDKVPKKYAGLDGTELAISESQERMAVVVEEKDSDRFMELAAEENLEATKVAVVTEQPRLVMHWRGTTIVDMARSFLDTNGAASYTRVVTEAPAAKKPLSLPEQQADKSFTEQVSAIMGDLSVSSQKGLVEMFDSSIGASTV
ncbi:MAG: phosphoribosylformylglycinamidine synthase, partial [Firmicutes bacterium]|nr:phosphoribosylformylglycinamidine synthase [Bacillota bacterium]